MQLDGRQSRRDCPPQRAVRQPGRRDVRSRLPGLSQHIVCNRITGSNSTWAATTGRCSRV
jgi:hypothetical protein